MPIEYNYGTAVTCLQALMLLMAINTDKHFHTWEGIIRVLDQAFDLWFLFYCWQLSVQPIFNSVITTYGKITYVLTDNAYNLKIQYYVLRNEENKHRSFYISILGFLLRNTSSENWSSYLTILHATILLCTILLCLRSVKLFVLLVFFQKIYWSKLFF